MRESNWQHPFTYMRPLRQVKQMIYNPFHPFNPSLKIMPLKISGLCGFRISVVKNAAMHHASP
jgi:hypothetical protein